MSAFALPGSVRWAGAPKSGERVSGFWKNLVFSATDFIEISEILRTVRNLFCRDELLFSKKVDRYAIGDPGFTAFPSFIEFEGAGESS